MAYPTLTSGSTTLVRISHRPVRVLAFASGVEQRWRMARQLEGFTLNHSGISKTDMLALKTFFAGRKGSYDVFDFVFGGTTYSNCSLDSDEFRAVENSLGQYDVSLTFRQRK